MADLNNGRPTTINGLRYKEVNGEGYSYNAKTATWTKMPKSLWSVKKRAVGKEERMASAKKIAEYGKSKDESTARSKAVNRARAKGTKIPIYPMSQKEKDAAKASTYNKTSTAKRLASAKNPAQKPAPTKPTPTKPTATKPVSGSSSSTSKTTAKSPAKKMGTVSQSNTEWVKKGDVVNGKVVTKGYVAQKGKPERKVSANVKLVVDTARGKAGSKVSYTKGRATKKGK